MSGGLGVEDWEFTGASGPHAQSEDTAPAEKKISISIEPKMPLLRPNTLALFQYFKVSDILENSL